MTSTQPRLGAIVSLDPSSAWTSCFGLSLWAPSTLLPPCGNKRAWATSVDLRFPALRVTRHLSRGALAPSAGHAHHASPSSWGHPAPAEASRRCRAPTFPWGASVPPSVGTALLKCQWGLSCPGFGKAGPVERPLSPGPCRWPRGRPPLAPSHHLLAFPPSLSSIFSWLLCRVPIRDVSSIYCFHGPLCGIFYKRQVKFVKMLFSLLYPCEFQPGCSVNYGRRDVGISARDCAFARFLSRLRRACSVYFEGLSSGGQMSRIVTSSR